MRSARLAIAITASTSAVASCGPAPERPIVATAPSASVSATTPSRRQCVTAESAFPSCAPHRPSNDDPTPWPRPSQLLDARPMPITIPITTPRIAALAQRDEELPKLDPAARALLVAADAAYMAALSDDTKWPAARAAYDAFLASPSPGALEAYGRFMLARVLGFVKDPRAVDELAKITGGPLAADAKRELIALAALVGGDVRTLYATLKTIEPDQAAAVATFGAIGAEALRVGEFSRASYVFEALLGREAEDAGVCDWALGYASAKVWYHEDTTTGMKASTELMSRARAFLVGAAGDDAKARCGAGTLDFLVRLATRYHIEFVGARGERGTGNAKTVRTAIELYQLVLDNFTSADIDRLSAAGDPVTRPSAYRLRHAIADAVYATKDEKCAPLYDELIELRPDAPDVRDMIHRAAAMRIRSGHNGLSQVKLDADVAPPTDDTSARFAADGRLICLGEPPRSESGYEDYVDAIVDRARLSLLAHRWGDAAVDLRTLAFHHPDADDAGRASVLYLEALRHLALDQPEACDAEIAAAAPALFQLECTTRDPLHGDFGAANPAGRSKLCEEIRAFAPSAIPAPIQPALPPLPPVDPPKPTPPQVRYDSTSVSGELPIEVIERVARPYLRHAVGCYEVALRADPTIEGQLVASFVIARDGAVSTMTYRASSTLDRAELGKCVARTFYGMSFPMPEGGVVKVTYPLGLSLGFGVIVPQPENPVTAITTESP